MYRELKHIVEILGYFTGDIFDTSQTWETAESDVDDPTAFPTQMELDALANDSFQAA